MLVVIVANILILKTIRLFGILASKKNNGNNKVIRFGIGKSINKSLN